MRNDTEILDMRLLYLYLKDYRAIKDRGFNFDTWQRFKYDSSTLTCVRNDSLDGKNFFSISKGRQGVVNAVSAIIGDNGSGKTTIARAIASLILGKEELGDFIAVLALQTLGTDHEHLEIYYRLSGFEQLTIAGFQCPRQYRYNMKDPEVAFTLNQRLRLVYYSPLFTTERTMFAVGNSFNPEPRQDGGGDVLSVPQRAAYAVRDVSMSAFVSSVLREVGRASPENAIILTERKRLLQFLCDISHKPNLERDLDLHFNPLDNHAVIAFNQGLWERRVSGLKREYDSRIEKYRMDCSGMLDCEDYWGRWFVDIRPASISTVPLKIFFFFAIEYLTSMAAYVVESAEEFTEAANALLKVVIIASELGRKELIANEDEALIISEIEKVENYDHRFAALAKLMRLSQSYTSYSRLDGRQAAFSFMRLELKDRDSKAIKDYLAMMGFYLACRGEEDFLYFTFEQPPSAGESTSLSMWSRLYTAFNDAVCGKGQFRDVVLFIDEAETSMHPSWQRTLVARMVKMWQTLATGCHVHIIFSSHSPVLLSDIPVGNVIWLLQGAEVDFKRENFNTFGANIFDLYRLAFNQKNGTTGEFAFQKIKDGLADVAHVVKSRVECSGTTNAPQILNSATKKVLSQIGDPVLRKYLDGLKAGGLI